MQNIIFLDIDGVINDNHKDISVESIKILKQIINENNAKIVIIGSLLGNGSFENKEYIKNMFKKFNITNIDFIDPNYEGNYLDIKLPSRTLGIIEYLKGNLNYNYVILDDWFDRFYKLLKLNYYKINTWKGLTKIDYHNIIFKKNNLNHIKNINYHYRKTMKNNKIFIKDLRNI